MSKKTRTTSSSTQTRTPNNPTWVTEGLAGVGGALQGLMTMDPKSFVAGPSALQTKAFDAAGGLKLSDDYGRARGIFNDVAGAGANTYDATGYDPTKAGEAVGYDPTSAQAVTYNASSLLEGLEKYMSPYTGQVVDAALTDFDFGAGQTRANQALEEARSGAFGGSGAAIGRSLTEGEIMRGRGSLSANLRDQGFMRGAGLSAQDAGFRNDAARANADAQTRVNMSNAEAANAAAAMRAAAQNQFRLTDADAANTASRFGADAKNQAGQFNAQARDAALARQLQAGNSLTSLAETMGNDTRANLALQGALGADQRAIDQAFAQAPLSVLQQIAATYGGMPLNLLSGETTTGNSTSTSRTTDPMGAIGTLGSLALAPFTGGLSLAGLGAMGALGGAGAMASRALPLAGGIGAFSDRRLKTDIEKIGEREDGLGVYVYRYLWSPVRFIGVMAQEVLKVKPEAVIHTPSGYMAVNYGAL